MQNSEGQARQDTQISGQSSANDADRSTEKSSRSAVMKNAPKRFQGGASMGQSMAMKKNALKNKRAMAEKRKAVSVQRKSTSAVGASKGASAKARRGGVVGAKPAQTASTKNQTASTKSQTASTKSQTASTKSQAASTKNQTASTRKGPLARPGMAAKRAAAIAASKGDNTAVTASKTAPVSSTPAQAIQSAPKPSVSPAQAVQNAPKASVSPKNPVDISNLSEDQQDLFHQLAIHQQLVKNLTFARDLTREFVQSTGSMKKVMDVIFYRVLDVLEAEAGSLWMADDREQQNICHLAEGPAKDRIIGLRLPPGKGIVGQVIENNEAEVVLDCSKDSRFDAQVDKKSGFRTQSMICVPLVDKEDAFGAIQIINKSSGLFKQFTEEDRRLVEDLALSASIAVRNARLLETESRVKEMNTLMAISQQVVGTLDLDMVLTQLVNTTDELVDVSSSAVALIDEQKNEMSIAVLSNGRTVNAKDENQKDLLEIMEQVRQSKRTAYVANINQYRETVDGGENTWTRYLDRNELKAAWCTPLADEEGILGVLWLEGVELDFARGSKADMLYILATQATVALRNASLFQRIPFGQVLGAVGEKGKSMLSGWRKIALALILVGGIGSALHYLPIFRAVSGPCTVEARFGQGVYLPVAGRVDKVLVKEGQKVSKGDLLVQLADTPIRLKLIEAEARLNVLDRQIVEAKAAGDPAAMSRSMVERVAARAEVRQVRDELEKIMVRAPAGGVVLTASPADLIGREFSLGSEVLRLGDAEKFTVVVEVPEEELLDVSIGSAVRGVLRSRPGQGFRGVVRHVGRAYSVPVQALEEGVVDPEAPEGFAAEVTVTESDVVLRPGMTGQASIDTPDISVITRLWRRVVNVYAFWFGG
ncbi:MAG: GAF domain-containing protein [Magnetococcales bacterium]|nr:GAF domain-containing protein [Magnetococcales bacterium]